MNFMEWMLRVNVCHSTAKHYAGAIYGTLSRLAETPIYRITSIEEFDALALDVRESEEFRRLNDKGNRMYSSALKKYSAYLNALETQIPVEVQDVVAVERDESITATDRLAMVKARLGQGAYRRALIDLWQGQCSVTGYSDARVLMASHIKPWYLADNRERLNPHNGLLLTPNLDKVFDCGLITFDPKDKGRIVFSPGLVAPETLGLEEGMQLRGLDAELLGFLKFHKNHIFLANLV